jgi:2-dehydropantoate 2-reductase
MRILMLGAGATGGYFGGRLLQHGRDVTFLVRPRRAAELARDGLVIRSASGDADLPAPPTVLAADLHAPYDLIVLKAYGLQQAMADIAPAVGPQTVILPLLNGMQQLHLLDQRFGAGHVFGGLCFIAATLDGQGVVRHLNDTHGMTFGERDGSASERMRQISAILLGAGFDARPSQTILQDMWDKWIFLASLAGMTCLMRGSVGEIVAAPGGEAAVLAMFEECRGIAERSGYPPGEATLQRARRILTEAGSSLTASMLRDLRHGYPIEADHVIGDMLQRAAGQQATSAVLPLVYAHLKVYDGSRKGESQT